MPPHVLYSSGPRCLEVKISAVSLFLLLAINDEEVPIFGSVKATHLVFLTDLKCDCFKQL